MDVAFATRRFPPPWIVEEHNDACFIVRDAAGQALGYFYFEDVARSALGGRAAPPRRGPAHRRQHRQPPGGCCQKK
jgi:hypothetical protein